MRPEDFEHLQSLLLTRAGFALTRDRMYLADHRLGPVARREGYASVEDLLKATRELPVGSLAWSVIEAMLNAETWFRRDRAPFASFGEELAPAISTVRPGGRVRVWSAGCGAGQEAWSLAMMAAEAGVHAEILGTDLAQRQLEKARSGLYTQFEVQRGLAARQLLQWFEPHEEAWRVSPQLRAMVRFERDNLMDAVPPDGGRYDVVFCRYVLSDMEVTRRQRVLERLEASLVDDGCLFLGLGESPGEGNPAFRPVSGRPGLFVKTARPRIHRAA